MADPLHPDVRSTMINHIEGQLGSGFSMFIGAIADLKLELHIKELEDKQSRDDLFGLLIDCVMCFLPAGALLDRFVDKLSVFQVTDMITSDVLKNVQKLAKEALSDEVPRELSKYLGKKAPGVVSDLLSDTSPKKDLKDVITDVMTNMYNHELQMIKDNLFVYGTNLTALPDSLVSKLFARWNVVNNKRELYTELANETFNVCMALAKSLGTQVSERKDNTTTVTTKILFECTEYGDIDSQGVPESVEVIPYILTSSVEERRLGFLTKTLRSGGLKEIPSGLRHLATVLAFQTTNYWNDPFKTYAFDPRDDAFAPIQFVHTLRTVNRSGRMVLKRNPKGAFGTHSPAGQHLTGSIRFEILISGVRLKSLSGLK